MKLLHFQTMSNKNDSQHFYGGLLIKVVLNFKVLLNLFVHFVSNPLATLRAEKNLKFEIILRMLRIGKPMVGKVIEFLSFWTYKFFWK